MLFYTILILLDKIRIINNSVLLLLLSYLFLCFICKQISMITDYAINIDSMYFCKTKIKF
uniref:Uncharacterized protein n=1 Tax=Agarophyton chilense TaxID=2510777 RepID=O49034_AGACH|nr:ORF15 [Agarophyton chilense]